MAAFQQKVQKVMLEAPQWEREGRNKIRELNHEVAAFAVGHLIDELRRKYQALPEAVAYLEAMQQDVIENVDEFVTPSEPPLGALLGMPPSQAKKGSPFFR